MEQTLKQGSGVAVGAAPPPKNYLPPISFFSFFFSSSAFWPLTSFLSFCSAGAGSPAKDIAVPIPNVRNAVRASKLAKRRIVRPSFIREIDDRHNGGRSW